MQDTITKAEIEKYISNILESRLQQALEEYIGKNEVRIKELAVVERVVRVEEELKAMREMSEVKFDAMEKRFEALQREMIARFEAVDKRFEALQREMNARFEVVDKRFTVIQWMIGIFVGIPAFIIALTRVLEILQ